ncbi:DUF84 family protein [Ammoniphilus sp. YIM 78166]|uniref:DUF84 family protein n=1 Tax=Ammoniphilus sp. YIM 78166 TaxID=1644106 RepID=UPI00106F15BC|nr:DUF84 family protein [Ammoniphilus sp. YIM 78166]
MNIAVGSHNPAKLDAVEMAFSKLEYTAQITGLDVPSDVSPQPLSDEETIQGAINRAKAVLEQGAFDYGIGLEGGLVKTAYGTFLCNWGAVVNRKGVMGIAGGLRILLPDEVVARIEQGYELGDLIDEWAGGKDIRKNEGTIGILTHGHITRRQMFQDVTICAMSKFLV